jgi:hypothetical protein
MRSIIIIIIIIITIIHNRFSYLLEAIEFIAENDKPDERFEAKGILTQLMKPLTICLLVTMSDVFSQFGPLSDVLQAEKCDLASALKLASANLQVLEDKRSDKHFHKLRLVMTNLATANNIEMSVSARRVRKPPSTLRQFVTESTLGYRGIDAENEATAPTEEFYRITAFFPIVDNLIHEMERRFNDEETLPLLQSIGACHPDSSKFLDIDTVRPLEDADKLDETGTLSSQIDVCKLLINRSADKPSDIPI